MNLTAVHPTLVHFSIALLSVATFAGLYAKLWGKAYSIRFADTVLILGTAFSILTVIFGFVSWHEIVTPTFRHTAAFRVLICHRNAALTSFCVYLIATAWRAQQLLLQRALSWWVVGLLLIGFVLLCIAGWYGGQLVYHYHIA